MDKLLRKIEREIPKKGKKAHKDMKVAIKKDKKRDPACEYGEKMMHKKKK